LFYVDSNGRHYDLGDGVDDGVGGHGGVGSFLVYLDYNGDQKSHIDGVPLSSTPFFDRLAYLHSISQSSATFWVAIGGEFFLDDLGIVFETYHGFGIWLYSAEILHVSANISIASDLY